MSHADRIAREEALTDALRIIADVVGNDNASAQVLHIIDAIKRLRANKPARVRMLTPIDYLSRVQELARAKWLTRHAEDPTIGRFEAVHAVDTPIGVLRLVTWRTEWRGGKPAWAGEYSLDDAPITIAEIRAAGLAQRPTTRKRRVA